MAYADFPPAGQNGGNRPKKGTGTPSSINPAPKYSRRVPGKVLRSQSARRRVRARRPSGPGIPAPAGKSRAGESVASARILGPVKGKSGPVDGGSGAMVLALDY